MTAKPKTRRRPKPEGAGDTERLTVCSICAEAVKLVKCSYSERARLEGMVEPRDRQVGRKWLRATCAVCGTVMLEGVPHGVAP